MSASSNSHTKDQYSQNVSDLSLLCCFHSNIYLKCSNISQYKVVPDQTVLQQQNSSLLKLELHCVFIACELYLYLLKGKCEIYSPGGCIFLV